MAPTEVLAYDCQESHLEAVAINSGGVKARATVTKSRLYSSAVRTCDETFVRKYLRNCHQFFSQNGCAPEY